MKHSKWIVLGIAAMVVVGVAVALSANRAPGGLVDADELTVLAADGVRVVDVRTVGEFKGGHIPDAENVPLNELAVTAEGWDQDEPVAVYCATGNRSADAAATLRSLGFQTVYDLGGGIAQWSGQIESEPAAAAGAEAPAARAVPVMYEFYTDW